MAFDIDGHVDALPQNSGGGPHGRDTRVPIAAIDWHERTQPHRFPEEWIVKQLLLRHHRSAARNQRQHDRRIDIGHMFGHENVSALGIKFVESDGFDPYPGEACPGPRRAHSDPVKEANVSGEESPGKTQHGCQWKRQAPEREHHHGANHGRVSPTVCASPLSQAARRAFCSGSTLSRSIRSNSTSCRVPSVHCRSRSPAGLRTRRRNLSPGRNAARCRAKPSFTFWPLISRIASPTDRPARSAALPAMTADTSGVASKFWVARNPGSAIETTRRTKCSPTLRKKSSHGISSLPATYFWKNHPRPEWLTASAAWR